MGRLNGLKESGKSRLPVMEGVSHRVKGTASGIQSLALG